MRIIKIIDALSKNPWLMVLSMIASIVCLLLTIAIFVW